jgi:hypothetical protein
MRPTVVQRVALIREVDTAANLIRAGLTELQYIDGGNRFYRLPMTLLGQGLERLMKVAIALNTLETTGSLPTPAWMKNQFQHDILKLSEACGEIIAETKYASSRPAAAEDALFFSEAQLKEALVAAQGFAERERYADLDRFLDPMATTPDPDERFDALEATILGRYPEWERLLGEPGFTRFYVVMVDDLLALFQRFARAVARLYVWGPLGDLGREASGPLTPLLTARDEHMQQLPKRWMIDDASRGLRRTIARGG